ncbi:BTAD domain-containing putative transcriptional regulator [Mycobacterium sp. 1081908.1]|uniref:BTAD domain-containing putative transcriptional regulator n=1 Tax=Mycobacterium sp. 1081908.1 TaxID=1834066 RepID=UPI0008020969|nr:BTAD domain-containing putative transcriptional regulator [Mycobacterium sp. 1081908.1]OBK46769.1 regulator [Mycobacterium sp. 1081908.1]
MELGVLGPLQVRRAGTPVAIPGAKPRAILTMLGLHVGSVVSADTLVELLWGEDPPRTAAKALQTHISSLRRTLGDGFVLTEGAGWTLAESEVDASRYKSAARRGRDAAAAGDTGQAVARFEEALELWRGIPELPDGRRGTSEKTRWIEGHAALVEDRADALLATGRAAEIIGELEAAVADAPLRERRWAQLMLALYRAGRQGEALGAYQRARTLLAEELGVDPGPELRRLEAAIVAQDAALETPGAQNVRAVTRAVTFLLTDIEGSTAAWEADADAMGIALARHDELVEQVVTSRGGRLIKTRGEGDATFSVFERPSAAAAAALELQEAIVQEPWALRDPMRIRIALHTGEAEFRDGDYFGRAVNRAARLRSLAAGGQILCSGATAELVIDSLPDDVVLADLGTRQLKNLARPEHVFELRQETSEDRGEEASGEAPLERPGLPAVLAGPGPFVGRGQELERLFSAWQTALAGGTNAVLIAGEPGVGKTRLAGEWSRQAYDEGALVIYGRCDEDLGAPYQPFAEALRSLVPCLGSSRLRGLRGVEALLPLVPALTDVLPDLAAPTRADPDTERYALFDAVVALLGIASASTPVVLILDDLHWAAKPTLLLLRHLLRFGERARVQIIGTYRSTDLDRSHPLSAMLADLHRDGTANRLQLGGLDEEDVSAYVAEAGYNDEELARALASVTGGNPFFLIEALRHVDESGGRWDQSTLPQGVREAVSRRLSRLAPETNKGLAAAAVVGSRFALDLVERVVGDDLVDAFDEACKAGIVIEEPGGRYRFNHALVRQSLLAELPSVRRMRLHQRIATTLENEPGADDELLAELAHHYFECAWAGNAVKAVEYCRRAADQAMARLAYEGAADLYDRALHALEEIDDELPDRDDHAAELLVARCEALLAAGDVASAASAVAQLQSATVDSARLAAWATCFDGQLSMLIHPERLDEIEAAVGAAAGILAEIGDSAGEAKAHTVRAGCLARLGRIGDCEVALDDALTAARRAREHRRVNAVLAQAPLAALWGPNPVPRAGGRCLDVVRLLRITTESPAVEATSTRCQAVLEAFRGRAAAARRMIDSARRTVTELGLRHALVEVEQFAGIVELVVDEPAAAEPNLRKAYNGFRRMGLDADTAETAALLGRTCLLLDRDAEADELCSESERLAGHALKPSIAWRTLRARLLSRAGDHAEARRVAEAAVSLAERTDALVDHGDACLSLATVLGAAGDAAGARAAAERAAGLYDRKGAAALAEKAHDLLGRRVQPVAEVLPEAPSVEIDNAAVRVGERVMAAIHRGAWDEFEQLFAPDVSIVNRRKVVGVTLSSDAVRRGLRHELERGDVRVNHLWVAARGERLALSRLITTSSDASPGAPQDELLQLYAINEEGQVALQVWFDLEDMDAALAELDAAHARFEGEHPPARRLDNAAARVFEHVWSHFAAGDWGAVAATVADNYSGIDHRRVVNAGTQHGRDSVINDLQAAAGVGFAISMVDAIAVRGERLVLARVRAAGHDPEAISNDALNVVEIDASQRIATTVTFDLEDFDSAIAELDARYLAGEAAPYAQTWSALLRAFAAFNRHELPATAPDWVNLDHRRGRAFSPGELIPYITATWEVAPQARIYIESVHRLSNLGAVVTQSTRGTSPAGFDAEWLEVTLLTMEGDLMSRCEVFDEADLDTAIESFEGLHMQSLRQENTASQVAERFLERFDAGDWNAIAEILADDFYAEDHRRVVGAGVRNSRDVELASIRAGYDLGGTKMTSSVIATRGARLILTRTRYSGPNQAPDAFLVDVLAIVEINADNRIAARIVFEPDDIDAAIAELDARYLAGEAAPHAQTWSVIAASYAALNRHELPATTPDCVNFDHRQETAFGPGDVTAYTRAGWDHNQDITIYVEQVHRLDNLGAVITYAAHETSREGLDAEWRGTAVFTVEGDLINRTEVFDEADIDSAIARFEQLSRPAPRLENAASQAVEQWLAHFTARDWGAMAEQVAEDYYGDDRRPMVSAGPQRGRDVMIGQFQTAADLEVTHAASEVVATRANRVALTHAWFSRADQGPAAFRVDLLYVVEINADGRISALVAFDTNQFEAAIQELDARYVAGEAAPHAHTWSVVAGVFAALKRHEISPTTPDFVDVDRRRLAVETGGFEGYLHAIWEVTDYISVHITAVHRLTALGAVVTHASHATSQEGLDVEWQNVNLLTVDGELISRAELFDEADLDAALARFDELEQKAQRRLENAASQAYERFRTYFAARDWVAMAELLTADTAVDDHRRVVNAETRRGRDVEIANMRAFADIGVKTSTATIIATRGERLVLSRTCISSEDHQPGGFRIEMLIIVETSTDNRILARVAYDPEDIDAAFAELDARYLAGEAAAHARTWTVLMQAYAALNRHEMPSTTPDWVNVDHRRGASFASGEMFALLDAAWNLTTDLRHSIEAVHRLNDLGAVVTNASRETSQEGFDAEWRVITVVTVEGDMLSRCEVFDEADVDTAIARFEQLNQQAPRLENAATRVNKRIWECFDARDWDKLHALFADDMRHDDRRQMVGAGVLHGRDAQMRDMRAYADIGVKPAIEVIAIRGERLALTRARFSRLDPEPQAFLVEALIVVEIDADERMAGVVAFEPDDIDNAFEELEARYLAGEAAPYARVWQRALDILGEVNRHEPGPVIERLAFTDHRRIPFAEGDFRRAIEDLWPLVPDARYCATAVHALDTHGVVASLVIEGSDAQGNELQWARTLFFDPREPRLEIYEESDVDTALARFEELRPKARRLENAASRMGEQFLAHFAVRDWDAMGELLADDVSSDDRRSVVNTGIRRGRDVEMANWRAIGDVWSTDVTSAVLATRGERLALFRVSFASENQAPEGFSATSLAVVEINDDNRMGASVVFDIDDIDAAFEELDARYLAGEAAAHAHTWSVIAQVHATLNRHEMHPTTPDWVNIDHRRGIAFAPGDIVRYARDTFDDMPDATFHIVAVHRLSSRGAVITQAIHGTSRTGLEAEWQHIALYTFEGDVANRCEIFDDADLDAALARFEELRRQTPWLKSRAAERFLAHFSARDWDAMAQDFAGDYYHDDRRRVVNAGVRYGRESAIEELRVAADIGLLTDITLDIIATRGERLILSRYRASGRDSDAIQLDALQVTELDADERIVANVSFDSDDVEAAFEELDARYLAGQAAAHARTWSAIAGECAAFNRHEIAAADYVTVDHRPLAIVDAAIPQAAMRSWDVTPDFSIHIEAVHRLNGFGAVATYTAHGTSVEGFGAEWRVILLLAVAGDRIDRCEVFDDADLDAALARLDELHPQVSRPENAASSTSERFWTYFAARDWDATAELTTENICSDDRRRVVNGGVRHGREAHIADMRVIAEIVDPKNLTPTVVATRGARLALSHIRSSNRAAGPDEISAEVLSVVEIDADGRIAANIGFDIEDIDAALAELDARYLAGEAAAHAEVWSVIAGSYSASNRHELPGMKPDSVYIDNRAVLMTESEDLAGYLRSVRALTPDISVYIEAVHRLSDQGAVITQVAHGTSQEGFDAEWRAIVIGIVEGDLYSRVEVFDEADLDAALARFEELQPQAQRLENAAGRMVERYQACFSAHDWAAMADLLADDVVVDDRRRVVNAGVRRGRVHIADLQVAVDVGAQTISLSVIATRGEYLALAHARAFNRGFSPGEVGAEWLGIVEIDANERIITMVTFELDDADVAFEELDARYLAGEAAAHAHTWSLVTRAYAALNRRQLPEAAADWVNIDHRRLAPIPAGGLSAYLLATWDLSPQSGIRIEAVHRLSKVGAVVTQVVKGTSHQGFEAEWRTIDLSTYDGDKIKRTELFDEDDLDAALARFDELNRPG